MIYHIKTILLTSAKIKHKIELDEAARRYGNA